MGTSKEEAFFSSPLGAGLSAIAATLLWGSAYPFIKLGYKELQIESSDFYGQMLFAGYRFSLAALLILAVIVIRGSIPKQERGTWAASANVGLFQTFLQYIFFYVGLSMSTGVQGAIIAGTTSMFQMILAHFMYRGDTLTLRKTVGLLIGFSGVLMVVLTQGPVKMHFGWGDLLLLVAMFCGALGNLKAKNASAKANVLILTSRQMLLGAVGLVLLGAVREGFMPFDFTPKAMLLLGYLAFLSATGFVLWNYVMKYNSVGNISLFLFLIPVFGVGLSGLMLDESLNGWVLVSLALVCAGIVTVNRNRS